MICLIQNNRKRNKTMDSISLISEMNEYSQIHDCTTEIFIFSIDSSGRSTISPLIFIECKMDNKGEREMKEIKISS